MAENTCIYTIHNSKASYISFNIGTFPLRGTSLDGQSSKLTLNKSDMINIIWWPLAVKVPLRLQN